MHSSRFCPLCRLWARPRWRAAHHAPARTGQGLCERRNELHVGLQSTHSLRANCASFIVVPVMMERLHMPLELSTGVC